MLLFNSSGRAACYYFSIRPMLLFNSVAIREGIRKLKFQYIPCCYSTSLCRYLRSCVHISIHPMLLFNALLNAYLNSLEYFNTSYVIIQPTKNRHSCILLIYINHDFKPFFQHFTNHSIENQKITW